MTADRLEEIANPRAIGLIPQSQHDFDPAMLRFAEGLFSRFPLRFWARRIQMGDTNDLEKSPEFHA